MNYYHQIPFTNNNELLSLISSSDRRPIESIAARATTPSSPPGATVAMTYSEQVNKSIHF
jgi:hypothetical protein